MLHILGSPGYHVVEPPQLLVSCLSSAWPRLLPDTAGSHSISYLGLRSSPSSLTLRCFPGPAVGPLPADLASLCDSVSCPPYLSLWPRFLWRSTRRFQVVCCSQAVCRWVPQKPIVALPDASTPLSQQGQLLFHLSSASCFLASPSPGAQLKTGSHP